MSDSLQAAREGDLLEAQSSAATAAIEVALARGTDLGVTLRDPLVLSLRSGAPASPLLEETLRRARLRLGEHVPSQPPRRGASSTRSWRASPTPRRTC